MDASAEHSVRAALDATPAIRTGAVLGEGSHGGLADDQRSDRNVHEQPAFQHAGAAASCPPTATTSGPNAPITPASSPTSCTPTRTPRLPLAVGGLYELWRNPAVSDGHTHRWLVSTTIITHSATDAIGHVHDRMPLLIPEQNRETWLNPSLQQTDELNQLLHNLPEPELHPRLVSTENLFLN